MSQITDLELLFIENFVKIAVASSWNMGYVSFIQQVRDLSNPEIRMLPKTIFATSVSDP